MLVPGRLRLVTSSVSSLGLLPPVFKRFGMRFGLGRLWIASARCRRTRMSHRFRARGFRRILGNGPAVFGGFGTRFLFRGLVQFTPFLMDLTLGFLSAFCMSLALDSLRRWRRFLRTPLVLFQVVAVALVCPQFI